MGLVLGVCAPILGGYRGELTSPIAFLERPARWVRSLAENPHAWSAAPNFAFDLAARKTTDSDLAGLDLGGVLGIISGAERVEPATLANASLIGSLTSISGTTWCVRHTAWRRQPSSWRPAPGVNQRRRFTSIVGELSAGRVQRCSAGTGTALVKYKVPQSPTLRIVDSDTNRECPHGVVGEIWVHGANVADGYWRKPPEEQRCFGATLVDPSPGHARRTVADEPATWVSSTRVSCSSSAASRIC